MAQTTPCPNAGKNQGCTCPHTSCARHGACCQCIAYHLPQKQLPQCYVKAGM
ncbi:MAG: DUF6485 family protein [Planctomycetaceae bacterium]|nr:DUF6485 family protein [Planctomycetaceae bacterium]